MDENIPPFAMTDLYLGDNDAALTIMSRTKRFNIVVMAKNLRGPQGDEELVQTFSSFKESMDHDPEAMEAFQEWMLKPCVPHLAQLAPPIPHWGPSTLAKYFDPETFFLELRNNNGHLQAIQLPSDPSMAQSLSPKVSASHPTVSQALSQGSRRIPASSLVAVTEPDSHQADYDLIPNRVAVIGEETQYHFKGAFEQHSFMRELKILLQLKNSLNLDELRTSKLGGLALTSDGLHVMGLLISYIQGSETLGLVAEDAPSADRERWALQIRATVENLHAADIVWGDVKPDNVLVDSEGNAWVIDFGGGCAEGWVDRELEGTKEGDVQGLSSIEKFLGI